MKHKNQDISLPGIFDWCSQSKGWLKGAMVYLAPTEGQHRSGTVESHIRQVKGMMRSAVRKIRKESFHPFNSFFELDLLLTKVMSLLNSRPIWGSETGLMTIQDLLTSRLTNGKDFVVSQDDLVTKDNMYRAVFKIFSDKVVDGNLTKTGKKAHTGTPVMETGAGVNYLSFKKQMEVWISSTTHQQL